MRKRKLGNSAFSDARQGGDRLGAAALELTSADLREIDDAAWQITVQGDRYPEQLERPTGR